MFDIFSEDNLDQILKEKCGGSELTMLQEFLPKLAERIESETENYDEQEIG